MASIVSTDDIDPGAVRLFLAVIELGSVSKAASRMHLSQPSATARLQKLERQLGLALLERTPTGSAPTDAGTRLVTVCTDALAALGVLAQRAESIQLEQDHLVVAATRHIADHFLPRWLADIGDGGGVRLVEQPTLGVAKAVRSGDAMIGFTEGPAAPVGLGSALAAEEEIVAVVGRGHEWWGRTSAVMSADLLGATLIESASGSGTRDVVEAALARHGAPRDVLEVANSSAARLAAVAGSGVAMLPACWVASQLADGTLHALNLGRLRPQLPIRVVWRGTRPASATARRLVERARSSDD